MMVKVCGLTNAADAQAAVEAGASALGFIFYPKSPRYVEPEDAASIIATLPRRILKVGVFVNEKPREIERIAALAGLDVVQLHGSEVPARIPRRLRAWKAFRITPEWRPELLKPYDTEAFLLDSPLQGETFDWRFATGLTQRIILAGGLDASNVRAAVATVKPWGVDACSRIESRPGRKDHDRMRRFIEEALAI